MYKRLACTERKNAESTKEALTAKQSQIEKMHKFYEKVEGPLYGPGITD